MTLCSALTWRIGGAHQNVFFVISFTLRVEYFLSSLEKLAELNELREALGDGFEPLDDEVFLHSFGSENSKNSRIYSSDKHCPDPKLGNFLRYSTISSMGKMKSWILVSRVLYSPLLRFLF